MTGAIEKLLMETIGLDSASVGPTVVRQAVRDRMAACRIANPQAYREHLTGSPQELQELINAVVIPETWFFRDREAFTMLARHARVHKRAQPTKVLSLPCSTGEEAYSVAMAMFDAGFEAHEFNIDAVDVSTRNIALAERAVYGRNSFRGSYLEFRDRYFEAVEGGLRPSAAVLKQVRFRVGNLFGTRAIFGQEVYDIVLCRNLLIYFNRELQDRALTRLKDLLATDGLLLVGPAEAALPRLHGFISAEWPLAFAFLESEPIKAAAPTTAIPVRTSTPKLNKSKPVLRPRLTVGKENSAPALAKPVDQVSESLVAVERIANAGRVKEAQEVALAHLEKFGPSAQIFYLLGLVQDADGAASKAAQSYRKALYLAPNHREALVHLALLLRKQGDHSGAEALADRLVRVQKRSGT
ncbi:MULTISPECIES: protein-glutamate O-methyltransferase CheR [unclassified Mesorhizobium]|uniref:CheR family methyltransferase n=1 Tax=unclassified Mesorhizobium TaxID=325217 RepID=UPI001126801E|nr:MULTISPECIES: protein-glutamate O-methyltransferase CheR [unclassified Mesorhizobium]TPJ39128.1 methyltransferase [Mesorhizobium sp. B2-6-6]MBZ9918012.1 methyltransferase [Mesorhizobium sp. BR1-1-7]MBZ9956218.1 methyltransferase [Mesorhizobium sp. BR1-1-15]MBZ9961926.1 methyltransferase [Mesorhizobium sp. BR1-1-14]MBZ9973196.1 methyltransferase [Mesorhizobium sp. BR1-1-12]